MEIKLTANILGSQEKGFTAWINEIKGVVAQGETLNDVKQELFKILRIKLELEREARISNNSDDLITEEFKLISA